MGAQEPALHQHGGFFRFGPMFPSITITADFSKLQQFVGELGQRQLPYATAVALTRTGQDVKAQIERDMADSFDRPTPYTMRGFRLYPARKDKLSAEVWFRPAFGSGGDARDYLAPQVFGGARRLKAFERSLARAGLLPDDMHALPGEAAQLDQYGNMARSQIVQILSWFRTTPDGMGYGANMTDKRKAALARGNKRKGTRGFAYFVGRVGDGRGPLGIWQRLSFGAMGSAVKPVVMFVKAGLYEQRLDIQDTAQRVTQAKLNDHFAVAWRQAMATARGAAR